MATANDVKVLETKLNMLKKMDGDLFQNEIAVLENELELVRTQISILSQVTPILEKAGLTRASFVKRDGQWSMGSTSSGSRKKGATGSRARVGKDGKVYSSAREYAEDGLGLVVGGDSAVRVLKRHGIDWYSLPKPNAGKAN